jgi:hypothetical protein
MRNFFQTACSGAVVANAVRVALVVGAVLNVINQGTAFWGTETAVSWWHVAMNFAVPYCVATYSAVAGQRALQRLAVCEAQSRQ